MWWIIVAAMGGWTFDDFCGTPPRPWPGPWPWILRKVVAAAGGVGAYMLIGPNVGGPFDVLTVGILGGMGGVVVAGLVGMLGGGMRNPG